MQTLKKMSGAMGVVSWGPSLLWGQQEHSAEAWPETTHCHPIVILGPICPNGQPIF